VKTDEIVNNTGGLKKQVKSVFEIFLFNSYTFNNA